MPLANKNAALVTSTAIALSMVAGAAHAGGFAIREQSAYYQGMSFAGYGTTSDSISSMFWNPASLISARQGLTVETHNTALLPYSDINGTLSGGAVGTSSIGSGDIAGDAWLPAGYAAYRLNDSLIFGVGVNAPFGMSTKPENDWAARFYSRSSTVFSLNVNPNIAYQINDMISIAAGVQVQYLDVSLKSADATSSGFARSNEISGDDIGFGVTAGITVKPFEGTEFGLGYRSGVSHELEGNLYASGATSAIHLGVTTPDMINFSAKQKITDKIRLLGTIEWTNWSRLKAPRATSDISGATLTTLHFNYDDGWFFSLGGEYGFNDKLTLRAGLAYEISPIDEDIRSTRLPDNNRWWLSAGASYAFNEHLAFDLGYTHIIPEATEINIDSSHQDYKTAFGNYSADVDSHVNIVAASLRYKF